MRKTFQTLMMAICVLILTGWTQDYTRVDFYWHVYEDTTFLHRADSILNLNDSSAYSEFDPGVSQAIQRARRYYRIDFPGEPHSGRVDLYDGRTHRVRITHYNRPQNDAKAVIRFKDRVYFFAIDTIDFLEKFHYGIWEYYPDADSLPTQEWEFDFRYGPK